MPEHSSQLFHSAGTEGGSPQHGDRGDRAASQAFLPAGLTVALSREAGSRGTSIAQRAAAKLGWQLYTQEMLEYLAQAASTGREIADTLAAAPAQWVEAQIQRLQKSGHPAGTAEWRDMARVIFTLAASGEVLLIGRGAGYVLPRLSTLHVRIVAPLEDRIAYLAQWLRLTREEAATQVHLRDQKRSDYLRLHFQRDVSDVYQFDLLLNSTLLGEDLSAELLAQAARVKLASLLAGQFGGS